MKEGKVVEVVLVVVLVIDEENRAQVSAVDGLLRHYGTTTRHTYIQLLLILAAIMKQKK